MQPTIKMPDTSPIAAKLKEARVASGLSTHAVAALIKKRFPGLSISAGTVANYERSVTSPGIDILGALAMVYSRPLVWFLERSTPLTGVRYRVLSSKTSIKERHQFEQRCQYWLESYIRLEYHLDQPLNRRKKSPFSPSMTGKEAAHEVRKDLGLKDDQPVYSVIEILENYGIRTLEMPTELKIDGFASKLGGEPVVILNPSSANDRCRLNAAHELAHVLFQDCDAGGETTKEMDNRAFEFGSYLLIPPGQLEKAFIGRSAVRLVQFKEKFGISMAAMIFRAEKQGIISNQTTKSLWIQFSRRGWRANEPGRVRSDRAIRFERMLDQAISEKKLTWSQAAEVTGLDASELRQRRDLAMGIFDEEVPNTLAF